MGTQRNAFTPLGPYPRINLPTTDLQLPFYDVSSDSGDGTADPDKITANNDYLERRLSENHRYLDRVDWGSGNGTRWRTIVIAAANSTLLSKSTADYVCPGVGDETVIQLAVNLLETYAATQQLGRIVLLEGQYNLAATITINTLTARQIAIEGMGSALITNGIAGTVVTTGSGAYPCFTLGGSSTVAGSAVIIENMHLASNHTEGTISSTDMPTHVRFCSIINTGGGWCIAQNASTGTGGGSRVENCRMVSNGTGMQLTVGGGLEYPILLRDNIIQISGGGSGIFCQSNAGTVPTYEITDNFISGGLTSTGSGIILSGNTFKDCVIANNTVRAFTTGIFASGYRHNVSGNMIDGCSTGIASGSDSQYLAILANHVTGATVAGISVGTVFAAVTPSIIANKVSNSTGTGITVGALATNAGVYLNDVFGGYSTGNGLTDTGTSTRQALTLPTGGATNTVLKKNSATDGDVSWAVDPALDLLTAKGSMVVASAVDTGADFPIGRDNALLYPDAAQTLGMKWGRTLYVQTTDPALSYTPVLGDIWIDST